VDYLYPKLYTTPTVLKEWWTRKTKNDIRLGSIWHNANDNRNVPVLNFDDNKRKLNLNWFDNDWNDNYRFLGVRKCFYYPVFIFKGGFLK
jgi:hypothetical protein